MTEPDRNTRLEISDELLKSIAESVIGCIIDGYEKAEFIPCDHWHIDLKSNKEVVDGLSNIFE